MRATTATYQSLLTAVGTWCEIRVIVGSTTYGADNFKRIKIWSSLFENKGPAIGGTISAEIELITYLETTDWPRMAKFMVDYRLVSEDELTTSEWIRLGTFYTAYRIPNSEGTLTIHGLDPMRLLEQTWADKISDQDMPASWPITAQQAVDLILLATDFELDTRSSLDNITPFIGLDTTSTAREMLESVAAGMGANWCITPEGKLRLIPLRLIYRNSPPAIAGIAVVGQSIVGDGERPVPMEPDVRKFSAGEELPAITQVSITADDGTVATSGTTGYTVNGKASFASTDIAYLALRKLIGFQYKPFDTDVVWVDPACELGDFMLVGETAYPIYQMDIHIGQHIVAACSAPAENEIDEEYVIIPESAKTLQKSLQAVSDVRQQTEGMQADISELQNDVDGLDDDLAEASQDIESLRQGLTDAQSSLNSTIQQTATDIRTEVSENYYTKDGTDELIAGVNTELEQTSDSFEASITYVRNEANGNFNEVRSYVRYENGQVIVGKSTSQSDLRISNEEVGMYYGGTRQTYWNQNEQVTPGKVRIPVGGSLQEGNFLWQPRSSGNLSLMWVGS